MRTYLFEEPLIRGTMLKRISQFTALVDMVELQAMTRGGIAKYLLIELMINQH